MRLWPTGWRQKVILRHIFCLTLGDCGAGHRQSSAYNCLGVAEGGGGGGGGGCDGSGSGNVGSIGGAGNGFWVGALSFRYCVINPPLVFEIHPTKRSAALSATFL